MSNPSVRPLAAVLATALVAVLAACSLLQPAPKAPYAKATLHPTSGNQVRGVVTFRSVGDSIRIDIDATGLTPNSVQAVHIHERGDCSAPDATSAGAHFNPANLPHGHHAGDLPNLQSDGAGVAHLTFKTRALSIGTGANNILGRAVVIHRDADDYASQPAGNSGPRVACGAIELAIPSDD